MIIYRNKRNYHKYLEVIYDDEKKEVKVRQFILYYVKDKKDFIMQYTGDREFHVWSMEDFKQLAEDYSMYEHQKNIMRYIK